jgi:hypothetical protein
VPRWPRPSTSGYAALLQSLASRLRMSSSSHGCPEARRCVRSLATEPRSVPGPRVEPLSVSSRRHRGRLSRRSQHDHRLNRLTQRVSHNLGWRPARGSELRPGCGARTAPPGSNPDRTGRPRGPTQLGPGHRAVSDLDPFRGGCDGHLTRRVAIKCWRQRRGRRGGSAASRSAGTAGSAGEGARRQRAWSDPGTPTPAWRDRRTTRRWVKT